MKAKFSTSIIASSEDEAIMLVFRQLRKITKRFEGVVPSKDMKIIKNGDSYHIIIDFDIESHSLNTKQPSQSESRIDRIGTVFG